jgi:hypothetical protein
MHLSEDPKKICSYSPYIMYMIEKVAKMEFWKMWHTSLWSSILARIQGFHLLELNKTLVAKKKYLRRVLHSCHSR